MMINIRLVNFILFLILIANSISTMNPQTSLKESFSDKYLVGTALNSEQIRKMDTAIIHLVTSQFNTLTSENMLKWEKVHPNLNEYNFEPVDSLVSFSNENSMFLVGHTLIWHQQTPDWVFQDDNGNDLTREQLLSRMQNHIHTVVGRYKGKIDGWDVVNEAFLNDGTMRNSKWREIIGDDYIEKAFQFAHETDPEAELYYNDFNMWYPGKVKAVSDLVDNLISKGIRIDGIGLQGHWGIDYPENDELESAFAEYAKLKTKIMITELDMRVLPTPDFGTGAEINKNFELQKKYNPYTEGFPDSMHVKQSEKYASFFSLFNKYAHKVSRVTFWGVHDGYSWRNYWPIWGRTSYPLLFDRECNPKPAYHEVINTVSK